MATDRFVFLGDSITEGVASAKKYSDIFAELTGKEVHNYGKNGAQSKDLPAQIAQMEADVGDRFDCLCIFIGTNDYNSSVPLGNWFTETTVALPKGLDENGVPFGSQTRKKRDFVFTADTFRGRLNLVLGDLRQKYVGKRIVLITPIHRGFAFFGGENYQPDETYSNSIGSFLEDYVQVIREASDIWSCELIDLYREGGFFPLFERNYLHYFANKDTDHLHPNATGHEQIARLLQKHLSD